MNRRHFLKGTGTALLGVATAALALKATANTAPYVEWTTCEEWDYNGTLPGVPGFAGKIKLSCHEEPIFHRGFTRQEVELRNAYVVSALGWKDGSRIYYRIPSKTP